MAFNDPPKDQWSILYAPSIQTKFSPHHVFSWFWKDVPLNFQNAHSQFLHRKLWTWFQFRFTNVCSGLCGEKCGTDGFVCQWGNRFSMAIFDQVAVPVPLRVPGGGTIATIWPDSPSPAAKHKPMKSGWSSKATDAWCLFLTFLKVFPNWQF